MTKIYKILRALVVTLLAAAIILPVAVYILLSVDAVQSRLRDIGERELTSLLGAEVNIGKVDVTPFNKVLLTDVSILTAPGDTAVVADRLGAGFMFWKLVVDRRLVFSYAEIIGLDVKLWRDSVGAPLNIQPVIERLMPKDKTKPPVNYDLRINNIVVRRSRLSYDVKSKAEADRRFDRNHVEITDLKADILLPRIKNDDYVIDVKRLALKERSGLEIESFGGVFSASTSRLSVSGLRLEMPSSLLEFADMEVTYDGWRELADNMFNLPADVKLLDGSHIATSDLACFVPVFAGMNRRVDVSFDMSGPLSDVRVRNITAATYEGDMRLSLSGRVSGLPDVGNLSVAVPDLSVDADASSLADLISSVGPLSAKSSKIIANTRHIHMSGRLSAKKGAVAYDGLLNTSIGNIVINSSYDRDIVEKRPAEVMAAVVVEELELNRLLDNDKLGTLTAHMDAAGQLADHDFTGHVSTLIDRVDYNGYDYNNVDAKLDINGSEFDGYVDIEDENVVARASGKVKLTKGDYACNLNVSLRDFSPNSLRLTERYPGYRLACDVSADLKGRDFESMDGRAEVSRLRFADASDSGISLEHLTMMASGSTVPQYILLHSDIFDAQIKGNYRFRHIVPTAKDILSEVFPALFSTDAGPKPHVASAYDNMAFDFKLDIKENETTDRWLQFFKSPVRILHPVALSLAMDQSEKSMQLTIDAPNLLQKNKFIDNTSLLLAIDGEEHMSELFATTLYPTKKGAATIALSSIGGDDKVNTRFDWNIDRKREFKGNVDISAAFMRNDGNLDIDMDINESRIVLNDTAWTVNPAKISVSKERVVIDDIDIGRPDQFIRINGVASAEPDDEICIRLNDINLDYIFEILDIGNAMFGGVATGNFYASGLFGKEPRLLTPGLHVDGFSYNYALLGDADIVSGWNNATKGVDIMATVSQPNGRKTYIDGAIYPMDEALDFRFKADRIDVKFMKPYMEAFTSDISGYASGDARLYGTFKFIDMTGDIFAEDLRIKLDFTNTYYTTTDSIHLTPGRIAFGAVTLQDMFGNKAHLDGWVTHKCFKEPEFEFNVTDARDFLCFDVNSRISPDWYGRIFCNGMAHIKGVPGFIDMNVSISTAPKSTFTFVLSDTEAADEYTFMTFRDRDGIKGDLLLSVEDPRAAAMKRLKEHYARLNMEDSSSSIYRMNLQVDATPDGEMILIMDPVGGDRIKARGNGNLRIEYTSADDDMRMFGTYTLAQGSYNFTLQDIIIKDFTIKPGSSIAFHGDPLAATLDIEAIYSVNANLSDLDESFLQDRELNRTNVPVHALLKVNGDMRQPDIKFDLEFPTLTQDTYRKVRSIVSTEDMMNRQIIYLLALNRFYTPDYMGSTTKGNELVSVASSTISSQLGSMLGQLSDNWSIAPNIRSDRGDFSDMEVDLALSSYLLNNRLLFNGNFGYRDKTLNNNSFIGDFDIEYLLNKSGNIRLKAYNRYNDQAFYVKSALTTQGVGVMFRKDFDNLLRFLHLKKKKDVSRPDTTMTKMPVDSLKVSIEGLDY
ncbi:translocation/assembly module TamB domain-containing protein [Heminiphilus faecis]|uniref:Translocation/assembly module TamB domain-containing protein n=1 Tax=Heminiphilus faecis TaxID=2601703 RepID=A0ABV4CUD2_9BACT